MFNPLLGAVVQVLVAGGGCGWSLRPATEEMLEKADKGGRSFDGLGKGRENGAWGFLSG